MDEVTVVNGESSLKADEETRIPFFTEAFSMLDTSVSGPVDTPEFKKMCREGANKLLSM